MAASPKRLEIVPYTVAQPHAAADRRQPAGEVVGSPGGAVGLDMKYALTPGLTLTGTVNPDFGQVEADPAVVNLSAFETFFSERRPFFVEGSGTSTSVSTATTARAPACSTRGGSADRRRASTICRAATASTPMRPRRRRFSAPRSSPAASASFRLACCRRSTQQERATILTDGVRVAAAGRAADELHGRPRPARVRQPVVDRLHGHGDEAPARRQPALPARQRLHRRRRLGPRGSRRATASPAIWSAAACTASPRRSSALQRTAGTTYQRPDADQHVARSHAHGARRRAGDDRHQQDRRRAHPVQLATSAFKSPGFDINDVGFLRRADERDDRQLVADPQREAESLVREPVPQLQPVRRLELRRRSAVQRRQRQRARDLRQQLVGRRRRQRQRARRSTIA